MMPTNFLDEISGRVDDEELPKGVAGIMPWTQHKQKSSQK